MTQRHFALQVTVGSVLFTVLVALVIHQLRTPAAVPPRQPALERLARYGPAPDFSLVERSGRAVSARDLRGQIWIADFIYTKCQDTCPLQSRAMAALQSDLKAHGEVRSVSITVDPLTDTPALLSQYADRYGADPERWLFLTGELQQIRRIVQDGFRLSAAPVDGQTADPVIFHSARFVLVDRDGEIRGYYDSNDPQALKRLRKNARSLLAGKA
ncbi:MAG: SCO family protein [Deltaproteobacteria bacterium]|nr:SCO family protein [Deltaproteobacteria bacterium]